MAKFREKHILRTAHTLRTTHTQSAGTRAPAALSTAVTLLRLPRRLLLQNANKEVKNGSRVTQTLVHHL